MNDVNILKDIKLFLDGYDNDFKYLVNVEVNNNDNVAECIIHEPNCEPKIVKRLYEPFLYMKDLPKLGYFLYSGHTIEYVKSKEIKYGITITKLNTGNQKRLVNGYCYKITSSRSYNDIMNYLRDGGINPYEKLYDDDGIPVKDSNGDNIYPYRDLFYSPSITEQFFISTKTRLYKGIEEYKDVHRVTFDIETTGLRYETCRVFSIGIRDNRGYEKILNVGKENDDDSESELIKSFFYEIFKIKPAIISGYNSESFDFDFLLGRSKLLKIDLTKIPTGLKDGITIRRRPNTPVKYGNVADKYTSTIMWGISVIDILHAAKKTAANNSELKSTKLKYIAKFEKIAKPNRTYIPGEDNMIGKYFTEDKMLVISENNDHYIEIPEIFLKEAKYMETLQSLKSKYSLEQYNSTKQEILSKNPDFYNWLKDNAVPNKLFRFISGKTLVTQYLLDDLWETEQVDELYNQSSFMLAKIVPTSYHRICTMGTAAIWNLLLTAWSYENDIAIPASDVNEKFSGGLARCYKKGYTKRIKKIDYNSLYPMIQLTENVFPIFDITGVIKKILLYLTTTRNIYKNLGSGKKLKDNEINLLKEIDHEMYEKYVNNKLTSNDVALCKVKQSPIKILNNSLFGALGSGVSFNWSDNVCAARITTIGRLHLRHAVKWFSDFGCVALLAVTDGINFQYPELTNIRFNNNECVHEDYYDTIEKMWKYDDKDGMDALILKFNKEEMKPPYMAIGDDGDAISSLNLSRINYANLIEDKNKKTGEVVEKVKLTGNTIKSKVMPEYIEEFIDNGLNLILHGKGKEFVDYYYSYCEDIRYQQIPLKKIANKNKVKVKLSAYLKRGKDKNGREKGKQAHMELLIEERNKIAEKLFEELKHTLELPKNKKELTIADKMKFVSNYMPPEPELDSTIYLYNTGYAKSHGDSRRIIDKETGVERYASEIINNNDLINNPNLKGKYNYAKYLAAFNSRVKSLLVGFDPEVQKRIIVKLNKKGELKMEMFKSEDLELRNFDSDNLEDSMYLEPLEVDFWNKTGYDPRLIWDGFKMSEDNKVYFEIYENALKYLNDKMDSVNKPHIKSINDSYNINDLILIKDNTEYHIGEYTGTYIRIIRENVNIPKSEIEIILDKKILNNQKKIEMLKVNNSSDEVDYDDLLKQQEIKYNKYFPLFLKEIGYIGDFDMYELFRTIPDMENSFISYMKNIDDIEESEVAEYGGFDDE